MNQNAGKIPTEIDKNLYFSNRPEYEILHLDNWILATPKQIELKLKTISNKARRRKRINPSTL